MYLCYIQSPDIVTYAMYNDQPPPTVKAADGRHAHSKGSEFESIVLFFLLIY